MVGSDLEVCGPSQPWLADWTSFCDLENFLCREGCISEATRPPAHGQVGKSASPPLLLAKSTRTI
jgi:hypothetical protein